jgi:hypothetical protein
MTTFFDTAGQPIIAANFDYFRLPPQKWTLLLTRLAQLGANTITLPVPWNFHQPKSNVIDLSGESDPRRNLILLLKLCAGLRFTCILQPGPHLPGYGILNDGLPLWLGNAPANQVEKMAQRWLVILARFAAKQQWPDGPITALRLSFPNEAPSELALSSQVTHVQWPIWLRKRYPSVDEFNRLFGTEYRTVSEAEFPRRWSEPPTPLEEEARAFLAEIAQTSQNRFQQALTEAGWQVPIHPFDPLPDNASLPAIACPIQVDPCPSDICSGLIWAIDAPIHSENSLRENFWGLRQPWWQKTHPTAQKDDAVLTVPLDGGGLVLPGHNIDLKIELPAGKKPTVFQLNLDGTISDDPLRVFRGKLRGEFRTNTATGPTDLIFYLSDPTAPMSEPLAGYLTRLLTAKKLSLIWSASQIKRLCGAMTAQPNTTKTRTPPAKQTPYTIAEARRGLNRAETVLQKAMASIGGLEAGFDTILDRGQPDSIQAAAAAAVSAEIFEPAAQVALNQIGGDCAALVEQLKDAARTLQQTVDSPLTVADYRQARQTAVTAAEAATVTLLKIIEHFRLEITAEKLPLLAWQLHDQAQAAAEALRWGVLRR